MASLFSEEGAHDKVCDVTFESIEWIRSYGIYGKYDYGYGMIVMVRCVL